MWPTKCLCSNRLWRISLDRSDRRLVPLSVQGSHRVNATFLSDSMYPAVWDTAEGVTAVCWVYYYIIFRCSIYSLIRPCNVFQKGSFSSREENPPDTTQCNTPLLSIIISINGHVHGPAQSPAAFCLFNMFLYSLMFVAHGAAPTSSGSSGVSSSWWR